ncbi:MAG: EAL domain-containing protein [Gammaproteobacteria bacterium]
MEILIVDDEPKARESLSEILKFSGYIPFTAKDVPSAISLLRQHRFQLILLDLNMPEQDGHILLEHIDHNKIDTHALIISGEATFAQATRGLRFSFVQEFIKKPYAIETLLHSIKIAIEKITLKEQNKKIQARLSKSEQMHRFFVESSPDIIYMLNEQGEFVFLNNTIETVLGFNKSELIGQHYGVLVYPEDQEKARFAFNERRTGGRSTKAVELRLICKDTNQPKFVETSSITIVLSSKGIYKLKDNQKEFVGTYGVIRDINDRKLSENMLRKLNLAVENSPNLIIITDKNGMIEYANQKITEISGYTMDEVIGHRLSLFKSGETPKHEYQKLWKTIHSGRVWRGVLKNKKKNGETYWSQQSIAPMLDSDGNVTHFIAIQEDVTEALKLNEQISYQATHDPLTDLINRNEFDRRLKRVIQTAKTNHSEHALCYLDLDQFKTVNDTCNHTAGDELLRQISRQFSELIRQRDTLARLGGDEFAILMEHCSLEQAKRTAKKIHALVDKFQFRWEGHSFRVGVSIGLVPINADNGGFDTLLKQADMACYKAKEEGRNRTHVFNENEQLHTLQYGEMSWLSKINKALDNDTFILYMQKIVPLASAQGEHYEILLRMKDPQGNIIAPGAFLPAAERYQLSLKIDQWVVSTLFSWYQNNPERLQALSMCAINLSGTSLSDETMAGFITDQFDRTGMPASKICFEITETATISNLTFATKFISQLKSLGCQFSLDNFGSGLSSFAYLKHLPVDYLKIDGIFVKDIASDPVDLAMVKSINDIAHVMGRKTIAEFVENHTILALLQGLKVDYVQGYCYDQPSPLQ